MVTEHTWAPGCHHITNDKDILFSVTWCKSCNLLHLFPFRSCSTAPASTVCVLQPPRGPAACADFTLLTRNHKTAGKYKLCWPLVAVTRLQCCGKVSTNSGLLFWCCYTGYRYIFLKGKGWGQKLGKHCQQRRGSRRHRGECTWLWDFYGSSTERTQHLASRGYIKIGSVNQRWAIPWHRETESKTGGKKAKLLGTTMRLWQRQTWFLEIPGDACLVQIGKI